jgi:cytochrome c-type biogenesis protein CcmE
MHPARKKRLGLIILGLSALALVSGLILYALRQNINFFYAPTQIANHEAPLNHPIKVGGLVVSGSVQRGKDLDIRFDISDNAHSLHISYSGILPNLFRENQGVIAVGKLTDPQHFHATQILAKHDENYMPPEVADSLQ